MSILEDKNKEWGYVVKDGVLAFQKGVLSNWYGAYKNQADGQFYYDELHYNCVEQAMMHQKAILFEGYRGTADLIMKATDPRAQKDLGRQVKNYDDAVWNRVRSGIVFRIIFEKFRHNQTARDYLASTKGLILVEASPWDKIWGVGTGPTEESTFIPAKWQGTNLLGQALMDVRTCLENNV